MTTIDHVGDDDPIAVAIAEYLAAHEQGQPLGMDDWLARYPSVTAELRAFLDETDGVAVRMKAFRHSCQEPNLLTEQRYLGDYELRTKIGGNMGVVYFARQQSLPRDVAVKVLLRAGIADRTRFQAEAEAMARLHHPHIARILEVARGTEYPYFSMEWYAGGTLRERVTTLIQQPMHAAAMIEKIAHAVHYAHQRGILHHDLKPANILMDEQGQPRVADFGLAVRLVDGDQAAAGRGGTPAYMAPEQLTGEVTVATDVYGLGAILYELLTGHAPSAASSLSAVFERVRQEVPTSPHLLNAKVHEDLSAICMKCLAKEAADRYANADEVAADLQRYQRGEPTRARPRTGFGRVSHWLQQVRTAASFRQLGPALIGQAAFVLLTDSTVFVLLQAGAAEQWVWLAIFAAYGPFFVLLARERWANKNQFNPARRHLWSIWLGHAIACLAVFVAMRIATPADFARAIEAGYIACSSLNALTFIIMGSVFAGRQYLHGVAWVCAAIVMGVFPSYGPLLYAVLMAVCCLLTGLQLNALQQSSASD